MQHLHNIIELIATDKGVLNQIACESLQAVITTTMVGLKTIFSGDELLKVDRLLGVLSQQDLKDYAHSIDLSENYFGKDAWMVDEVTGFVFDNFE